MVYALHCLHCAAIKQLQEDTRDKSACNVIQNNLFHCHQQTRAVCVTYIDTTARPSLHCHPQRDTTARCESPTSPKTSGVTSHRQPRQYRGPRGPKRRFELALEVQRWIGPVANVSRGPKNYSYATAEDSTVCWGIDSRKMSRDTRVSLKS